jgi:hypothetical protein
MYKHPNPFLEEVCILRRYAVTIWMTLSLQKHLATMQLKAGKSQMGPGLENMGRTAEVGIRNWLLDKPLQPVLLELYGAIPCCSRTRQLSSGLYLVKFLGLVLFCDGLALLMIVGHENNFIVSENRDHNLLSCRQLPI